MDDCPLEKYIPIYLVVGGVFTLWVNLVELVNSIRHMKNPEGEQPTLSKLRKVSQSLIALFLMAWFICGESVSLSLSLPPSLSNYAIRNIQL